MKQVLDIKEVDGKKVYKFSEPLQFCQTLKIKDKFLILKIQHGDYFEVEFIRDKVKIELLDSFEVVSEPYFKFTQEEFKERVADLILIDDRIPRSMRISFIPQFIEINCTDDFWEELFKGVDKETVNIKIDSQEYTSFLHRYYGRLVRIK
jgi:hypothetical protein